MGRFLAIISKLFTALRAALDFLQKNKDASAQPTESESMLAEKPAPASQQPDKMSAPPEPDMPRKEASPLSPFAPQEKATEKPTPPEPERISANDTEPISPLVPEKKEASGELTPPPKPPKPRGRNVNAGVTISRSSPEPDKYELICRKTGGEWNIFIRLLLAEQQDAFAKTFTQNNTPLEFDEYDQCKLTDYSSPVICADGEVGSKIGGKYIFRFGKNWQGAGRNVGKIARKGLHLVIAPRGQKRIKNTRPEPCADENFRAHYFLTTDGDGFVGEGNSFMQSKFSLKGESIYDNKGEDLFLSPPELEWEGNPPAWLVVTDETNGRKGGWNPFSPFSKTIPEEINGRTGAFCLHIYDGQRKVPERIPFRVTSMLKKILINGVEYSKEYFLFPGPNGHVSAEVRFIGEGCCNLHPALQSKKPYINEREDGVFDIESIESYPDGDFAQWVLEEEGVKIEIALPRVWWRFVGKDCGWKDIPQRIEYEEFRAMLNNAEVSLPSGIRYQAFDNMEISVPSSIRFLEIGNEGNVNMKFPAKHDKENPARSLVPIEMRKIRAHARDYSQKTILQAEYKKEKLSFLIIKPGEKPTKV